MIEHLEWVARLLERLDGQSQKLSISLCIGMKLVHKLICQGETFLDEQALGIF